MATKLSPYLNFRDGTREVMDFYVSVFGGELTLSTFADSGGMGLDESEQGKVMHSQLDVAPGLTLMAADTPSYMEPSVNGSIALFGDDEPELRGYFEKLVDGGTVGVPLEKAPWGDSFGMCTDKFGVAWMVNISAPGA